MVNASPILIWTHLLIQMITSKARKIPMENLGLKKPVTEESAPRTTLHFLTTNISTAHRSEVHQGGNQRIRGKLQTVPSDEAKI
jgi:hypothetical protein